MLNNTFEKVFLSFLFIVGLLIIFPQANAAENDLNKIYYTYNLSPNTKLNDKEFIILSKNVFESGIKWIKQMTEFDNVVSGSFLSELKSKLPAIYNEFQEKGDIRKFQFIISDVFIPLIGKSPDSSVLKKEFLESLENLFLQFIDNNSEENKDGIWYEVLFQLYSLRFKEGGRKFNNENTLKLGKLILNDKLPLFLRLKAVFLVKNFSDNLNKKQLAQAQSNCLNFFKTLHENSPNDELIKYELCLSYIDLGLYKENKAFITNYLQSNSDSPYAMFLSLLIEDVSNSFYISKSLILGQTVAVENFCELIFKKHYEVLQLAAEKTEDIVLITQIIRLIESKYNNLPWEELPYSENDSYNFYSFIYQKAFKILAESGKIFNIINLSKCIFPIQRRIVNMNELLSYQTLNNNFLKFITDNEEEKDLINEYFSLLKNAWEIETERKKPQGTDSKMEAVFNKYAHALKIYYENKDRIKPLENLNFVPHIFQDFNLQFEFYSYLVEHNYPFANDFVKDAVQNWEPEEMTDMALIKVFNKLEVDIFDRMYKLRKILSESKEESKFNKQSIITAFVEYYEKVFELNAALLSSEIQEIHMLKNATNEIKKRQEIAKNKFKDLKSTISKFTEVSITEFIDVKTNGDLIPEIASGLFDMAKTRTDIATYMMVYEFLTYQILNEDSSYKDTVMSYEILRNITDIMENIIQEFEKSGMKYYHPAHTEAMEYNVAEFKHLYARTLHLLADLITDPEMKIIYYGKSLEIQRNTYKKQYRKLFYDTGTNTVVLEKKASFEVPSLSSNAEKEIKILETKFQELQKQKEKLNLSNIVTLPSDLDIKIKDLLDEVHSKTLKVNKFNEALRALINFLEKFTKNGIELPLSLKKEGINILFNHLLNIYTQNIDTLNVTNKAKLFSMFEELMYFDLNIFSESVENSQVKTPLIKYLFSELINNLEGKKARNMVKDLLKNDSMGKLFELINTLFEKEIDEKERLNLLKLILENLPMDEEKYRRILRDVLSRFNAIELRKRINEIWDKGQYYISPDEITELVTATLEDKLTDFESFIASCEIKEFLELFGSNSEAAEKIGGTGLDENTIFFVIQQCKKNKKQIGHLKNILNNILMIQANLKDRFSYSDKGIPDIILHDANNALDFQLFEGVWALPAAIRTKDMAHKGHAALTKVIGYETEYFMKDEKYSGVYNTASEWQVAIMDGKNNRLNKEEFIIKKILKPLYLKETEFAYLTTEKLEETLKDLTDSSEFSSKVKEAEISMFQEMFPGLSSEEIESTLYSKTDDKKLYSFIEAAKRLSEMEYKKASEVAILCRGDFTSPAAFNSIDNNRIPGDIKSPLHLIPFSIDINLEDVENEYYVGKVISGLTSREDFNRKKLNAVILKHEIEYLIKIYFLEDSDEQKQLLESLILKLKTHEIARDKFKKELLRFSVSNMTLDYIEALGDKYPLIKDMLVKDKNKVIEDEVIQNSLEIFDLEDVENNINNPGFFSKKLLELITEEIAHIIYLTDTSLPLYKIREELLKESNLSTSLKIFSKYIKTEILAIIPGCLEYYYDNDASSIAFRILPEIELSRVKDFLASSANTDKIRSTVHSALKNNSYNSLYIDIVESAESKSFNEAVNFIQMKLKEIVNQATKENEIVRSSAKIVTLLFDSIEKADFIKSKGNVFIWNMTIARELFQIAHKDIALVKNEISSLPDITRIVLKMGRYIDMDNNLYLLSAINNVIFNSVPNNEDLKNISLRTHLMFARILKLLENEKIREPLMIEYKPIPEKKSA